MIFGRAKNGLVQKPARKGDTFAQMSIFGKEGCRASRKLLSTKRLRSPLKMLMPMSIFEDAHCLWVPSLCGLCAVGALFTKLPRNCVGRHGGL